MRSRDIYGFDQKEKCLNSDFWQLCRTDVPFVMRWVDPWPLLKVSDCGLEKRTVKAVRESLARFASPNHLSRSLTDSVWIFWDPSPGRWRSWLVFVWCPDALRSAIGATKRKTGHFSKFVQKMCIQRLIWSEPWVHENPDASFPIFACEPSHPLRRREPTHDGRWKPSLSITSWTLRNVPNWRFTTKDEGFENVQNFGEPPDIVQRLPLVFPADQTTRNFARDVREIGLAHTWNSTNRKTQKYRVNNDFGVNQYRDLEQNFATRAQKETSHKFAKSNAGACKSIHNLLENY